MSTLEKRFQQEPEKSTQRRDVETNIDIFKWLSSKKPIFLDTETLRISKTESMKNFQIKTNRLQSIHVLTLINSLALVIYAIGATFHIDVLAEDSAAGKSGFLPAALAVLQAAAGLMV